MVELLKQPQFAPVDVELQVASIYAGTKGFMDSLPVDSVREFEAGLHEFLKSSKKEILSAIVSTGKLEKATEEALAAAIKEFKERFVRETEKKPAPAAAKEAPKEPARGEAKAATA
jgi:F-type H+/Na+-transporting ATPase subunit alpha